MKVIGVVGWKNSGKTTLIEALLPLFGRSGLRVSTVKHAHHTFDLDEKGKDSYRHRAAGAHEVLVASRHRWFLTHQLQGSLDEITLDYFLARLEPVDLVIVEGFKGHSHPKIEVILDQNRDRLVKHGYENIIAIASKDRIQKSDCPSFPLDDPEAISRFILGHFNLLEPVLE